jgi:hypothetical protein
VVVDVKEGREFEEIGRHKRRDKGKRSKSIDSGKI